MVMAFIVPSPTIAIPRPPSPAHPSAWCPWHFLAQARWVSNRPYPHGECGRVVEVLPRPLRTSWSSCAGSSTSPSTTGGPPTGTSRFLTSTSSSSVLHSPVSPWQTICLESAPQNRGYVPPHRRMSTPGEMLQVGRLYDNLPGPWSMVHGGGHATKGGGGYVPGLTVAANREV